MTSACELKEKQCKPCSGDADPLKGDELKQYAENVPDWEVVDEHHITRTFKFDDFKGAWGFADQIAELAEQQGHHPTISFTWGKVDIRLVTHKIKGLSESDFIMAAKIDDLAD